MSEPHPVNQAQSGAQKLAIPTRDIAFLVMIATIWAVNTVLTKIALDYVPPLFLSVIRFLITAICLMPFIKPLKNLWKPMIVVALLTGPIHFGLQFVGIHMATDLSPMIIAMQMWIPASVILAAVFLNEKTPWLRIVGLVISFLGVAVLVFEPSVWLQMPAFGMVTLASLGYASASIIMRKFGGLDPVQAQVWMALVTIPVLGVASFAVEEGQVASIVGAPPLVWFAVLFAALVSGIVGNVGMWRMVQRYEMSATTPYSLLTPLIAIILGVIILNDPITSQLLIGGLLSLIGIAIVAIVRG